MDLFEDATLDAAINKDTNEDGEIRLGGEHLMAEIDKRLSDAFNEKECEMASDVYVMD